MRLATIAIFCLLAFNPDVVAQPSKTQLQFPAIDNDAAWAILPREDPQLPPWARALIGPLPKTTAKLLELEYLHRAKNPLGQELAALIQWTVADELGSKFGKATASSDLARTGRPNLSPEVQTAVAFARKLTREGYTITDAEFAELLKLYGPEKVTAIVHTVAYCNFFNRIVLGLGAEGEPVPPINVKFDPEKLAKLSTPTRPPWDDLKESSGDGLSLKPDWDEANHEKLNQTLENQKERKLRIPLPESWRLESLPPREKDGAEKILWNTISSGYQPEMPRPWFAALYTFYEEAKVDRVFTNSVFWVVTRTNDCFY